MCTMGGKDLYGRVPLVSVEGGDRIRTSYHFVIIIVVNDKYRN